MCPSPRSEPMTCPQKTSSTCFLEYKHQWLLYSCLVEWSLMIVIIIIRCWWWFVMIGLPVCLVLPLEWVQNWVLLKVGGTFLNLKFEIREKNKEYCFEVKKPLCFNVKRTVINALYVTPHNFSFNMSCSFDGTQVERELTSACVPCPEVSTSYNTSVTASFARSRIKRDGRGIAFLCIRSRFLH